VKTLLETRREVQLFAVCLWSLGEHLRNRPPWYSVPTGTLSFSDVIEWVTLTPGVVIRPPGVLTPDMALEQLASLAQAARALIEAVNQLPPKVRAELQSLTGHAKDAVSFARKWAPKLENVDSWPNVENLYCTDVLRFLQTIGDPRKLAEDYRSFRKKVSRDCALYGEDKWFDSPPPTKPSDCPPNEFVFRRNGDGWFIRGFGESGFVEDMDGLGYIHALLRANGPVPTVALIAGEATTTAKPLDGDPVLDDEAKKKYQSKIDELEDAIKEAWENNDIGRVEYLQAQHYRLIKELQSAYSIDGKIRRLGAEADKHRVRVRNAIRRAYKRLAESGLKQVADHFQSCVTIGGRESSYNPPIAHRPNWLLE